MTFGVFIIIVLITSIHNARCQIVKDADDVAAVMAHWLITQDIGPYPEATDKLILQCDLSMSCRTGCVER
jgi:hypothetical protein